VRIHDEPLYRHLKSVGIDFLIFAMRWVITLLVREMPIKSLIRYNRILCVVRCARLVCLVCCVRLVCCVCCVKPRIS
jgi:hypothetical protein